MPNRGIAPAVRASFVLITILVAMIASTGRALAGPACTGAKACEADCNKKEALACRELGRLRAAGDHVDPDHRAAAAAWTRGCDAKDPRSCYELSLLLQNGWTLEVARDTY